MNKQDTSQRNFDDSYTPELESIKAAFVSQKQRAYTLGNCGLIAPPEFRRGWEAEFDRAIAAHDKELREQIAQEIEARKPRASKLSEYVTGVRRGIYLAASITRGKTRASVELVERCGRCGCNLWYPTAAHVVDCGTRKEQEQ